jgi:O-antigen ligase
MLVIPASPVTRAPAAPFAERILLIVLFVAVLASSVAFIEPSPHDGLMGLLAFVCLIAGVRFNRMLAVPMLLLVVWNVGGIISVLNVVSDTEAVQYAATSVYLAVAAVLFASLLTQNTVRRLAVLRTAYILTAVLASVAGIAGYFHLFPGAYDLFTMEGRVLGGFKDPNVFAPFLIWPALVVLERMIARRIRFFDLVTIAILLFALLLAFSRGAWFHFALSGAIMLALIFITAPTQSARMRIVGLSAAGVLGLAGLVVILLSFDSIGAMFAERAHLVQSYDVDSGGRFAMQKLAVDSVLQFPNGMGPFGFANVHGLQQHNVYLQAFLVYGWVGGMGYVLLLLTTVFVGLRNALVRTPWQSYAIVAFAVFVGEVAEGFIIDTDHWRHFFLLLGMIWGLAAATANRLRTDTA